MVELADGPAAADAHQLAVSEHLIGMIDMRPRLVVHVVRPVHLRVGLFVPELRNVDVTQVFGIPL